MEELKCNGKWTNCAADLLPLALSNWCRKTINIFSSLTQKPVFDIIPTLCEPDQSSSIFLAYLSSEDNSIPSHYDGCEQIGTQTNHEEAIRTDDELNQIDTDIENVNNTENGTTESDTRTPIKSRKKVGRPKGTPQCKSHSFTTPHKKKLFRKRKATPEEWKKNIRKKLRMSGKEYISERGKKVPEKVVKLVDCNNCEYKCTKNITEDRGEEYLNYFGRLNRM